MIQVVASRQGQFNNNEAVARSRFKTAAKLHYYRCFARCYRHVVRYLDLVLANSSWTRDQLQHMWSPRAGLMQTVYPPCPIAALRETARVVEQERKGASRKPWIVS